MLLSQRCQVSAVADALVPWQESSAAALTRRLSRFLSNPRIDDGGLSQTWIGWVARCYPSSDWVVLVDETKLSSHLAVMMVGVAYRQRAIPLLWRCYSPKAYPPEGQVALIMELLARLRQQLAPQIQFMVQADRGLGTSPDLIRQLEQLGVGYLLRVQGQVRLRLKSGREHALATLVKPGETWCGTAQVFKKAGWLRLYVFIQWRQGEASPWCLVAHSPWRTPQDYRQRAWHEQSFRDLKSYGFGWQASQVWRPAHAHRLLFVLAVSYSWVLSQALVHTAEERLSPSRTAPRQSLFFRGLRWLRHCPLHRLPQLAHPDLFFQPIPSSRC